MTEDRKAREADPLSILSLAAGIGAMVLAAFSLLPLAALCTLPLSLICVLTSVISGIASLVRTTLEPGLEGRLQALAGLGLSLLWCLVAALIFLFAARPH